MLKIEQFRYASDNLGYLIFGERYALAVDGGAADEMLVFLANQNLSLVHVTNTHDHYDHTTGNDELLRRSKATYLSPKELAEKGVVILEGEKILIYPTPGHTRDAVCLHAGNILISGDTLFNGTVGNCFTGNLREFYHSIKKLMALPDETVIYAGHDYVRDSVAFAKRLEPGNGDPDAFLSSYDPGHVYSTLAEERRMNPYLRFNDERIIEILRKRGLRTGTEYERWESLMSID
ncbi:MAG TPA: hydroxyacylglutathione hydrolase [Syntrophales bacterium]|nr:hydroxyacylglutathione hydrolase [Syntrophales bacterium]HOX94182.1 hydroxyacylglutathione hydrolase [Syntrophales bacterium]HPI57492.1 hydroxyacylglutathione hydrolase [Syntrophales bacterium]HPN25651.1 hydroxyacylglutathione hydrolase [Syntrophales bacterium]HQM29517.1 hydroxyacylglutathione hydrolase [Syntrophales bacterium]